MHGNKCTPHTSQDARKTASWHKRCKGGTLPERKRLAWLLAAPESGPFSLIQNSFCAMSPHSIIRMCVSMAACIAEGRLAPANGRNPGRQDRRAAPCLLFRGPKNGAKNRPQKRGRNIAGRRQGFQNGGPVSGTRVLHTPSAPLCVQWVAETPEPFVCFPGNGLDKASSKFHSIYFPMNKGLQEQVNRSFVTSQVSWHVPPWRQGCVPQHPFWYSLDWTSTCISR